MNQIADQAGVALQTIYSSVGSKAAIISALGELIDEEAGLAELVPRVMAETDPRRALELGIRIPFQFIERTGDYIEALFSAAAVEPDAARALDEAWARHSAGAMQVARKLIGMGAVRAGLTLEDVHGSLALTTWAGVQLQARRGLGWDDRKFERWCCRLLINALLEDGSQAS